MTTGRAMLHGRTIGYDEWPGSGPLLLLVHGVGANATTWSTVVPYLIDSGAHVVTVDLPGHGDSDKSRGDYSLGAMANTLRDLLDQLGHRSVIVVGHSLGGGIALQFAYQYPHRTLGLVLVASGGLGPEASPLLRAASLPGAEFVLPVLASAPAVTAARRTAQVARRLGLGSLVATDDDIDVLAGLADPAARSAFLATLRSVVDLSGQRVSAVDMLSLAGGRPTLIIWGDRDPILPRDHGLATVDRIPGSRLVTFPGAGHEPHRFDPERFAGLVLDHSAEVVAHDGVA